MSGNGEEQDLEALLGGVAPRPEPPEDVRERVFAAAHSEWRRYKRRRWRVPVGIAAAALLALSAALLVVERTPADVRVRVADTSGLWVAGTLHDRQGEALTLAPDTVLEADGNSRLVTDAGVEVRLRAGTRITWVEPATVALASGSIYVDTGGHSHLRVRTPLGVVTDVGTTFMVTLQGEDMEVAMRQGRTAIDTAHGTYTARAGGHRGDVVTVGPARIRVHRELASAERWQWIQSVHPGYTQRQVLPLLQAIAQDLGLGLEFASPEVRAAAEHGRLEGGDLTGLDPKQALKMVLDMNGFARRQTSDGTLVIEFQSPPQ